MDSDEPTDDLLVRVYIKMRTRIAEVNKEYDERLEHLRKQQKQVAVEILKRLQQRGAEQTKTPSGTAFISEDVSITIADELAYGKFAAKQKDPWAYYQKRAKVERVQEHMKAHDGALPPGLSIFREKTINVRAPKKKGTTSGQTSNDGGADERPEE